MEEKELLGLTPAELIDALFKVRDERRALKEREKELIDMWQLLERQMMAICDEQGMKRVSSELGTVSITEQVLPRVVDWDAVHEHIMKTGDTHLKQNRISTSAFKELQDMGESIPGVEPYNQRKVSLRKL